MQLIPENFSTESRSANVGRFSKFNELKETELKSSIDLIALRSDKLLFVALRRIFNRLSFFEHPAIFKMYYNGKLFFKNETFEKYVFVLKISLMITVFSFIIEFFYPFIKKLDEVPNLTGVFIFRLFHYIAFVYFSTFSYIFLYKKIIDCKEKQRNTKHPIFINIQNSRSIKLVSHKINVFLYLGCVLLMELSWKIYSYCPATYYEFKMYQVNENDYHTTFHPCLYSIFRNYSDYIIYATGFAMTFNVIYILYNECWLSIYYKAIYAIIFTYLLFTAVIEHRT
jgi:hypothetical protein